MYDSKHFDAVLHGSVEDYILSKTPDRKQPKSLEGMMARLTGRSQIGHCGKSLKGTFGCLEKADGHA
jgi:hypothetical protein